MQTRRETFSAFIAPTSARVAVERNVTSRKGLAGVPSALTTASRAFRASRSTFSSRTSPTMSLAPFRSLAFSGDLTSAVTCCPRSSAWLTIRRPVPPVPPRTSIFDCALLAPLPVRLFINASLIAGRLPGDRPEVCFPGVSELAFRNQLAGPPKRGQQGGFVTLIAVELRLLRLLFRAERHLAAQADVAIEPQLQRAGTILEKFVDDGAFARTGGLEEGDLHLRLEDYDLAQIVTCDRSFTHDVRRALLHDLATGAEVGRKELSGVAGFEDQALPRLRAG